MHCNLEFAAPSAETLLVQFIINKQARHGDKQGIRSCCCSVLAVLL